MSEEEISFTYDEIIEKSTLPTDFEWASANHVRLRAINENLYMDFYFIGPDIGLESKPIARFVYRIVIPIDQAKGIATALANLIHMVEQKGRILPNLRKKLDTDLVELWE